MPGCSSPSTSEARAAAAWAAACLLLAGCAGGGRIPAPTAKHVESAGRNGQVTTLAALKVGRSLYIGRCAGCHSLKEPGRLSPSEWVEMVEEMAERSEINPDQQRAITQYLVAVSAAIRDTSSAAPAPAGH